MNKINKKTYLMPSVKVCQFECQGILAGSNGGSIESGGPRGEGSHGISGTKEATWSDEE